MLLSARLRVIIKIYRYGRQAGMCKCMGKGYRYLCRCTCSVYVNTSYVHMYVHECTYVRKLHLQSTLHKCVIIKVQKA